VAGLPPTPEDRRETVREYTDDELEDNALGLKHRELGVFGQVVNDVTVDHPDTKAYNDGRKGIDYAEQDPDEEGEVEDDE
jgi:hypothetical protein